MQSLRELSGAQPHCGAMPSDTHSTRRRRASGRRNNSQSRARAAMRCARGACEGCAADAGWKRQQGKQQRQRWQRWQRRARPGGGGGSDDGRRRVRGGWLAGGWVGERDLGRGRPGGEVLEGLQGARSLARSLFLARARSLRAPQVVECGRAGGREGVWAAADGRARASPQCLRKNGHPAVPSTDKLGQPSATVEPIGDPLLGLPATTPGPPARSDARSPSNIPASHMPTVPYSTRRCLAAPLAKRLSPSPCQPKATSLAPVPASEPSSTPCATIIHQRQGRCSLHVPARPAVSPSPASCLAVVCSLFPERWRGCPRGA